MLLTCRSDASAGRAPALKGALVIDVACHRGAGVGARGRVHVDAEAGGRGGVDGVAAARVGVVYLGWTNFNLKQLASSMKFEGWPVGRERY